MRCKLCAGLDKIISAQAYEGVIIMIIIIISAEITNVHTKI